MLERVALVQGVGLLHDANGSRHRCLKATLIYADNGRGKSTLASIMRSVSESDPAIINAYRTIDGTLPPKVTLHFGSGHQVTFQDDAWSEQRKELLVFDSDFVERNVHSGGVVNTNHRKNLLEVALGESAVPARKAVIDATTAATKADELVQSLTGKLSGYHEGITLKEFEGLPEQADIDSLITDVQKRIKDAENAETIQAKPVPATVTEPVFNIEEVFSTLALSLENVHANAEAIVKEHISQLNKRGFERWLSDGQQFGDGKKCPYCDQSIESNSLILAYQTHFNEAYNDLKKSVSLLETTVQTATSDGVIENIVGAVNLAATCSEGWADYVEPQRIAFDIEKASRSLVALRTAIVSLAQLKAASPAEPLIATELKVKCQEFWADFLSPVQATNSAIKAAATTIDNFKRQLSAEVPAELRVKLQRLEATKRRYQKAVVALFNQLDAARVEAKKAEREKSDARQKFDTVMVELLGNYQKALNTILGKFGAGFTIEQFGGNFRGKGPRTEYGLRLRGKSVPLEGGPPSFATALSDGDKRTLAFAFFIACALENKKLGSSVVVIDDPMCSLDQNRRYNTKQYLLDLHKNSGQLIVLAHDVYFLRELRKALKRKDDTAPVSEFRLVAVKDEYTSFGEIDLDEECESDYSKNYRSVSEFEAATTGGSAKTVKMAMRVMLEGYLHRRFPGHLSKGNPLGNCIDQIEKTTAPSPLHHANNLLDELRYLNGYLGAFHHDDEPDIQPPKPSETELRRHAKRALHIVHTGRPLGA